MTEDEIRKISVVGVDISLTSTGVSTFEGESNIFTKPDGFDHPMERYLFIRETLENAVENVRNYASPKFIIEGYAFAKRSSHAHAQGELGGIVRMWMHESGFHYNEIPPTSLKKFTTGKGNATKSDMVSSVTLRTGIEWSGKGAEDRVDAWGLRQMGLASIGLADYEWPAKNLESLDNLDFAVLG